MRVKKLSVVVAALLASSGAAEAAVHDFESEGQFSGNFRKIAGPGTPTQTGPGPENDFVTLTGTTNFTSVYDTTPADAAEKSIYLVTSSTPLSVTADLRFSTATSSFGVYVVDAADDSKGYLALFNINQTAANDLIRFSSNAVPDTGGAGTLVTGTTGDSLALNQFAPVTFAYSINASNNPVLSVTAGTLSATHTFTDITTPLTQVEVGIRNSSQTVGTNDFDNLNIQGTLVPEPAALGLLGFGALLLARRRRQLA